ncbi:hypothetical protein GCM10010174_05330 [Kutzneria viridogrisea]
MGKIVAVLTVVLLALLGETVTASAQPTSPRTADLTLRGGVTGRCIDDSNDGGFRTFSCNGGNYQRWGVDDWADNTHRLMNRVTGRCIDDSDYAFRTNTCNFSQYQSWYFIGHGGGVVLKNQATGRCIDDSNDGGFRTFTCNNGAYQDWYY